MKMQRDMSSLQRRPARKRQCSEQAQDVQKTSKRPCSNVFAIYWGAPPQPSGPGRRSTGLVVRSLVNGRSSLSQSNPVSWSVESFQSSWNPHLGESSSSRSSLGGEERWSQNQTTRERAWKKSRSRKQTSSRRCSWWTN